MEIEQNSFGIQKIVDCKVENGQQMYKVEWQATWEPAESLQTCQHLIDEFWSHINKAKAKEQVAQQHRNAAHQQKNESTTNIEKLSEDEKTQVQKLIQQTSSTIVGNLHLQSPRDLLPATALSNTHPKDIASTPQIKSDTTLKQKHFKADSELDSKDRKTIGTAGLKYLEGFTNPYVKLIVVCRICNREQSLKFSSNWYKHYMTHSDKKPFQCPHCPKSFVRGDVMRKHIQSKHGGNDASSTQVDDSMQIQGNVKNEDYFHSYQNVF